ncbi:MAG: hypothetical protein CM15mP83_5880 [Flavobacteriaceae bacterium]|nr:MAG: hypothetical protein CM15mP83_5880 [Flavobacteriaceae bacterium]
MILGMFLWGAHPILIFEPFFPTYYVGIFVFFISTIGYLLGTKKNSKP